MVERREAPPLAPPRVPVCMCVYFTGVGWPASGLLLVLLLRPAASPRVGREGRAGVDCLDGNCCVPLSRCPALWVAPSSGACFHGDYTHTPLGRPTHAGSVRVESDPRTRVSQNGEGSARPGGKGAPGRLDASFRLRGPRGSQARATEEEGTAPGSSCCRCRRHS